MSNIFQNNETIEVFLTRAEVPFLWSNINVQNTCIVPKELMNLLIIPSYQEGPRH